jgi:hypothetical protein
MPGRSIEDRRVANAPTVAMRFCFRDRDANRAKMTCYCAVGTADVYALGFALAEPITGLSNAVLDRVEFVWNYRLDSPETPGSESNVSRKILLLIINSDEEINAIVIPSPQDGVWETTGDYAGIRLDLASAGAIGFNAMLAAAGLRTDDDHELGTAITVGGLEL